MSHLIVQQDDQHLFAYAGNAKFTLVSTKTQQRFTYRIRQCKTKPALYFVHVLMGTDNENDYTYLGTVWMTDHATYKHGVKSSITRTAPCAVAFAWWTTHEGDTRVEFWHEGRCGRCGRTLTVPESIARGIGPECAGIMGIA